MVRGQIHEVWIGSKGEGLSAQIVEAFVNRHWNGYKASSVKRETTATPRPKAAGSSINCRGELPARSRTSRFHLRKRRRSRLPRFARRARPGRGTRQGRIRAG